VAYPYIGNPSMSNSPKDKTVAETVWPPSPSLPAPPLPKRKGLVQTLTMPLPLRWLVIADAGVGIVEFGITCLRRWLEHDALQLVDAGVGAGLLFITLLALHTGLNSAFLKRERESSVGSVSKKTSL
jgi:hypothetical protein